MHTSRMPTAHFSGHLFGERGCLLGGAMSAHGGCLPKRVSAFGVSATHPLGRQTPVKILPCPQTSFVGGKDSHSHLSHTC